MDFWNDISTRKSWDLLKILKKKFNFIVIGGWAIYLWTNALKSKDIDIILTDWNDLEKINHTIGFWLHIIDPEGISLIIFGDELTIESDTWKIFPAYAKEDERAEITNLLGQVGFGFRKVP